MVIAIDGPGAVGKSTVSRLVAERLGYPELNTGAIYRAATLAVLRAGADPGDDAAVVAAVVAATIDYEDGRVLLDGHDVTAATRSAEVTAAVSPVSAIAEVRRLLVERQRAWLADHGPDAVVEGRDIGTVVFPDAGTKVYLTARPEVRAARRARDGEAAGADAAKVAAELAARDRYDSSREVSPLRAADDAVTVDTSDLTIAEVVEAVVLLARSSTSAQSRPTAGRHRPRPV